MAIRNKNGDSEPQADLAGARQSLDDSANTNQKPSRSRREQHGRRLSFAPTKSSKAGRRPVLQTDEEFEAACLAVVLNKAEAERLARASSTLVTPPLDTSTPARHEPLEEAAVTIDAFVQTEPVPDVAEAASEAPSVEDDQPFHTADLRAVNELLDAGEPSTNGAHDEDRGRRIAEAPPYEAPAASPLDDDHRAEIEAEVRASAERDESNLLELRAQAEHHAALVKEHEATIERQSSLLAEREAEVSLLHEDLNGHRQSVENLTQKASDREHEVHSLREILSQTENESSSQTEMLMQSLHETEAKREAETAELSQAAQRLSETQHELGVLRESVDRIRAEHEAALSDLSNEHDTRLSELRHGHESAMVALQQEHESHLAGLRESMDRRESDSRNELEALRRTLDNTEAQRKANAAELVAASDREARAEEQIFELRKTLAGLTTQHETQVSELRELVSRREMEASALDQALLERETEWTDLHETMIQRDIDALKLTEQLRRALLHSEAQREADAASLLEIMAQREAADAAERANEVTRKHLAGY